MGLRFKQIEIEQIIYFKTSSKILKHHIKNMN